MNPSTCEDHPSGTTVVLSSCSMIAGPDSVEPGGMPSRCHIVVSVGTSEVNQTGRVPFWALWGAGAIVLTTSVAGSYFGTAIRAGRGN